MEFFAIIKSFVYNYVTPLVLLYIAAHLFLRNNKKVKEREIIIRKITVTEKEINDEQVNEKEVKEVKEKEINIQENEVKERKIDLQENEVKERKIDLQENEVKEVAEVKEVTEVQEREIKIQENEVKEVVEVKEVTEVKEKENEVKDVKENKVEIKTMTSFLQNDSTLVESPVSDKSREFFPRSTSSVSSSQFVFTSKDISIAKNSLDLVLKYFKESKLNQDICSKGLEIAQRSKLIFDGIAKEILKRQQSLLPKTTDTATTTGATTAGTTATEATTTGTTTTGTTTTGTTTTETTTTVVNENENKDEQKETKPILKLSMSSKFSQPQPQSPAPLTASASGGFESFVENCNEFYKFGDCLWNISTFFSYTINEDLEMREKILDLIDELDTATIELNEAIESWKSKQSRWGSVRSKIKVLAKFSIMRNNSLALLNEKTIKDCKIQMDMLKTQRVNLGNTITNNSDDTPILKGSRNHIRHYWYMGCKRVAVKEVGKFEADDDKISELKKEVNFLIDLKKNSHILEYFGYCQKENNIFSVISQWGDYDLQTYLAENIKLAWDEKLSIARGIADALTYCHGLKTLHYDVRTNNVLLDHNLQPKLYNFRIVKESPIFLISENSPIDDVRYCSPERIRGETYTTASEVYSFAMVMWEIQHHQLPYSNSTPEQINSKILANEKPELEPKVGTPVEYQCIIEEAWSFAPEKRPSISSIFSRLDILDSSYFFSLQSIELIGVKHDEQEEIYSISDTSFSEDSDQEIPEETQEESDQLKLQDSEIQKETDIDVKDSDKTTTSTDREIREESDQLKVQDSEIQKEIDTEEIDAEKVDSKEIDEATSTNGENKEKSDQLKVKASIKKETESFVPEKAELISNTSILKFKGKSEWNRVKSPEILQGIKLHEERKYRNAWNIFKKYESKTDDPEGKYWVGYYYLKGHYEKNNHGNPQKAVDYLSVAAKQDHSDAQYHYARTLLTSWADKEDDANRYRYALDLLRRSAKQNNPHALRMLGGIIKKGSYNQKRDIIMGNAMIEKAKSILFVEYEKKNRSSSFRISQTNSRTNSRMNSRANSRAETLDDIIKNTVGIDDLLQRTIEDTEAVNMTRKPSSRRASNKNSRPNSIVNSRPNSIVNSRPNSIVNSSKTLDDILKDTSGIDDLLQRTIEDTEAVNMTRKPSSRRASNKNSRPNSIVNSRPNSIVNSSKTLDDIIKDTSGIDDLLQRTIEDTVVTEAVNMTRKPSAKRTSNKEPSKNSRPNSIVNSSKTLDDILKDTSGIDDLLQRTIEDTVVTEAVNMTRKPSAKRTSNKEPSKNSRPNSIVNSSKTLDDILKDTSGIDDLLQRTIEDTVVTEAIKPNAQRTESIKRTVSVKKY
ncbi:hypothetical protein Glove_153g29 [Diversispora epigaea]|uniref:Protein kinase domain-containing protein n=1 Tax=Diversispora epigaea TaxID=1348612 RepID=A0A397ISL0_9GLOM|nr:hypothetical protein Glove_153g29 [Diversispora epigaea]